MKIPALDEFIKACIENGSFAEPIHEYQKAMLDMLDKGTGVLRIDRSGKLVHIPIKDTKLPIQPENIT